jgi:hypothetical protein
MSDLLNIEDALIQGLRGSGRRRKRRCWAMLGTRMWEFWYRS